jgi:hypothetical protein
MAKLRLPKFKKFKPDKHIPIIVFLIILLTIGFYFYQSETASLRGVIESLTQEKDKNREELNKIGKELTDLKNQDQLKRNDELENTIQSIERTYDKAVSVYEDLIDLKPKVKDTKELDNLLAKALSELSKRDYGAAEASLNELSTKISDEEKELAASFVIPESVPVNNAPPGSGYSRQSVSVDGLGNYLVSLIAGDLASTRVIVDTASDGDCGNDCPVLPLASYVSRNGAYAGVNGSYFCPIDYPSCAGKTNTFDLLVMNHKGTYFNSDNNVYSNNPAVIFGDGYVRFVSSASQWGRDTSPNGVLSNYPLLVFNSQVVFGGDDDPKKGSKGGRSFVANKGNTVYIGVVHSATVAESARVLATMGMENAMNLDDGGSTALWSGGYKVGPGRNLPNVILFVSK